VLDASNGQQDHEGQGDGQAQAHFVAEVRDRAWGCFSSAHKLCRNVCPVMGVTQNENHSPTAFHANVVAMEKGHLSIADVAEDDVHCTQCGACELRCPNTLMAGEFYRARTQTVDVVKAARAFAVEQRSSTTA
jgi:heterodisulfide reductase subunit D